MGTRTLEACLSRMQPGSGWLALALAGGTAEVRIQLQFRKMNLPYGHSSSPQCGVIQRSQNMLYPVTHQGRWFPGRLSSLSILLTNFQRQTLERLCEGHLLGAHFISERTLDMSRGVDQLSAGGLSEWGPRHAGLGNAIAGSSWVSTSCRMVGAHVWGIREGRAFLGDQPYTSSLPWKAPQSLHFRRMLVRRSDCCHQPLTCCHTFLQEAFYGSPVLSQSCPNSMRSYQLSGSALSFSLFLQHLASPPSPICSFLDTPPSATSNSSLYLTWTPLRTCSGLRKYFLNSGVKHGGHLLHHLPIRAPTPLG